MKLLNRTSYILITTVLFVFFIGSIIFYFVLKSTTEKEIEVELTSRIGLMAHELHRSHVQYEKISIPGYITVNMIPERSLNKLVFQDTVLFDNSVNSYKQYKSLTTDIETDDGIFRVTVFKSLIESNELIEKITLTVTLIILLFISFIYLLNRFIFEAVWSDFFKTVAKLKSYDVNKTGDMHFGQSDIAEFGLLNDTLNRMIGKIQRDYENMREFTGNISHEIQTPLTIIRQKSELLLQTQPLNTKQAELIRDIQKTNSRLANLNKTLVLLTKIENKQFPHMKKISVKEVIERHLETFHSLANMRKISIDYHVKGDIPLLAEPMLIDVLVVNLIKNAVSHNIENGEIIITTDLQLMRIANSGIDKDLSDSNIFERYSKIDSDSGNLGLGLSLVKKICDLYGFNLKYVFSKNLHCFEIEFNTEDKS